MTHYLAPHAAPLAALALALVAPLAAPAPTAPPPTPLPPTASPTAEEEIERLEAWPEVPKESARELKNDVQRLRKARTEAMGTEAHAALVRTGAGAAPALLKALAKEKDEAARARLVAVLDQITGAPHTRLLAAELDSKSQALRTFCLLRLGALPDPGTRAAAEKALAKAARVKEPEKADREEHLAAALAATAAGSSAGIGYLAERAPKAWGKRGRAMRAALEGARGAEAEAVAAGGLAGDRTAKIAALRLLAGCGTAAVVSRVKPLLDDRDNAVRIAAINALRGIVDGDPPLDKLPVFEAIEVAKAWKARV